MSNYDCLFVLLSVQVSAISIQKLRKVVEYAFHWHIYVLDWITCFIDKSGCGFLIVRDDDKYLILIRYENIAGM